MKKLGILVASKPGLAPKKKNGRTNLELCAPSSKVHLPKKIEATPDSFAEFSITQG